MSVERWLYMSRKSLVTSRRGCFTAVIFWLIPVPVVVFCSLETVHPGSVGRGLYISITAMMLFCFLTTFIAYFIVLRIIRGHQQQVQANEQCPNFAQPAINLAKYKKSVFTILYILALVIFGFFSFIVSVGVYVSVGPNHGKTKALSISMVFYFYLLLSTRACTFGE